MCAVSLEYCGNITNHLQRRSGRILRCIGWLPRIFRSSKNSASIWVCPDHKPTIKSCWMQHKHGVLIRPNSSFPARMVQYKSDPFLVRFNRYYYTYYSNPERYLTYNKLINTVINIFASVLVWIRCNFYDGCYEINNIRCTAARKSDVDSPMTRLAKMYSFVIRRDSQRLKGIAI